MEFLIVFLMLSIFLMVAWPAVNSGMTGFRLSAAAEEVVTAMEFAQLTAASGSDTQVTIDPGTDRIEVRQFKTGVDLFDGSSQHSASGVEGGGFVYSDNPMNKGTDYLIDISTESRFSGVNITASDFAAGSEVTFDAVGRPSKGGTVTLVMGDRRMVATLEAISGRVKVSE
jgi:Tfp pilus assembly protein FimT